MVFYGKFRTKLYGWCIFYGTKFEPLLGSARLEALPKTSFYYSGVQVKNNAYHKANKVQISFMDTLILILIDIGVCVVFALYSSIRIFFY
jgi:hypothetical protein